MKCQHNNGSSIGVNGGGQHPRRKWLPTIGVWGHSGGSSKRDGTVMLGIKERKQVMGIDWMNSDELNESIPPAYTEYIGKYLIKALENDASRT